MPDARREPILRLQTARMTLRATLSTQRMEATGLDAVGIVQGWPMRNVRA